MYLTTAFFSIILIILMAVIVVALVILIAALIRQNKKNPPAPQPQPDSWRKPGQPAAFPPPDESEIVAVITAAIAAAEGVGAKNFRVTRVAESRGGANNWYAAGRNDIINSRM